MAVDDPTATEFRVLYLLANNGGSVVTHSTLESTLLWCEERESAGLVALQEKAQSILGQAWPVDVDGGAYTQVLFQYALFTRGLGKAAA